VLVILADMSSQKWNCEADLLQDLQLLSTKNESLASAQASIELRRQSKPVKFQTTFGRGKKSNNNSDVSGVEVIMFSNNNNISYYYCIIHNTLMLGALCAQSIACLRF
jgi:hypothetical protein